MKNCGEDVNNLIEYYRVLAQILEDYQDTYYDYNYSLKQLNNINAKAEELGLGVMVTPIVLDSIEVLEQEESYESSEEPEEEEEIVTPVPVPSSEDEELKKEAEELVKKRK